MFNYFFVIFFMRKLLGVIADRELDKEFNDMIKNKGFTLDLPEDCPEDFAKVIRKCTHRDPEERPAFWGNQKMFTLACILRYIIQFSPQSMLF